MTCVRGVLSGVAAVCVALLGPGLLHAFRAIAQQKATGFGVVHGAVLKSLFSAQFWILAIMFFGLFFSASRLSSKVLRVALFWIPTVAFSTVGLAFFTFL